MTKIMAPNFSQWWHAVQPVAIAINGSLVRSNCTQQNFTVEATVVFKQVTQRGYEPELSGISPNLVLEMIVFLVGGETR